MGNTSDLIFQARNVYEVRRVLITQQIEVALDAKQNGFGFFQLFANGESLLLCSSVLRAEHIVLSFLICGTPLQMIDILICRFLAGFQCIDSNLCVLKLAGK